MSILFILILVVPVVWFAIRRERVRAAATPLGRLEPIDLEDLERVSVGFGKMPALLESLGRELACTLLPSEQVLLAFNSVSVTGLSGGLTVAVLTTKRLMLFRSPPKSQATRLALSHSWPWGNVDIGRGRFRFSQFGVDLRLGDRQVFLGAYGTDGQRLASAVKAIGLNGEGRNTDGDPDSRVVRECAYVGGFGNSLVIGQRYDLWFGLLGVHIGGSTDAHGSMTFEYDKLDRVDISGPGAVTTNAGIIGGGFGVKGAAEGMLAAGAINHFTSRKTVTTAVELQLHDCGMTFIHSKETPEQLRLTLAPVLGRLRQRDRPASVSLGDPVERLAKLSQLRTDGAVSQEEYEAAKNKLLGQL